MPPMTLSQQIDAFANAPDYAPKVTQTREFFRQVAALIRKLEADAARRVPCPTCQELPAFEIPTERDTPAYDAMRKAAIDRMHDMATETRRPVL